jgi:hypothetical protein
MFNKLDLARFCGHRHTRPIAFWLVALEVPKGPIFPLSPLKTPLKRYFLFLVSAVFGRREEG